MAAHFVDKLVIGSRDLYLWMGYILQAERACRSEQLGLDRARVLANRKAPELVAVRSRTLAVPTCVVAATVVVAVYIHNVVQKGKFVAVDNMLDTLGEVIQHALRILVESICQHYQARGLVVKATVKVAMAPVSLCWKKGVRIGRHLRWMHCLHLQHVLPATRTTRAYVAAGSIPMIIHRLVGCQEHDQRAKWV